MKKKNQWSYLQWQERLKSCGCQSLSRIFFSTVLQIICTRVQWKRHFYIMRCLSQLGSHNWWPRGDKELLSEQSLSFNWVFWHFSAASKQTWAGCSKGGLCTEADWSHLYRAKGNFFLSAPIFALLDHAIVPFCHISRLEIWSISTMSTSQESNG